MHNTHEQILHLYNSVFRGFLNYYSFVHNYSRLVSCLNHYLRHSCAKLLAAKFSLANRAQVFNKFGQELSPNTREKVGNKSSNNKNIKFLKPSYITNMLNFKIKASPNITSLFALSKSKARLYGLSCAACGSTEFVEMHRIIAMKDLNPRLSHIDKIMVIMNRKQLPLCRTCHNKKHSKQL